MRCGSAGCSVRLLLRRTPGTSVTICASFASATTSAGVLFRMHTESFACLLLEEGDVAERAVAPLWNHGGGTCCWRM